MPTSNCSVTTGPSPLLAIRRDAPGFAAPGAVEDEGVDIVAVGVAQREPPVSLAPRFEMREEMELRLLGYPGGFPESGDQFASPRDELTGIADAVHAVVAIPPALHRRTLHQRLPDSRQPLRQLFTCWKGVVLRYP